MTNETTAKAAADAPAKVAETIADTTTKVVAESKQAAKRERAAGARRAKRTTKTVKATAAKTARKTRTAARRGKTQIKRVAARPAATARNERIETVTYDFNNLFGTMPTVAPFQTLFADAGERGQDAVRRSQKVAEEVAELTRANVEALVDAGRIAAEGARTLGKDAVATTRATVEQTAEAVRTFAEAKSPTELMQLQGEFARTSFDRMVADTSKLTEMMVKLAGEAFQPLSNRASVNAERINQLVA